jgi:hypothetical protein
VRHVKPENKAAYHYWLGLFGQPSQSLADYAGELLRGTGLEAREVLRTHVYHLNFKQAVHRWHAPVLPVRASAWAQKFIEHTCAGKPFIHLHPYSTQSSALAGHWPHWKVAIEWLCEVAGEFGLKVVWTGAENPLGLRSPHLVNAVGLTPSMLEVFALQRLARLTICTTNGCAHWAVMDRTPAIACCNNHMIPDVPIPKIGHIFKEWISSPPVVQVEYRDKLGRFQHAVCDALSEVGL